MCNFKKVIIVVDIMGADGWEEDVKMKILL